MRAAKHAKALGAPLVANTEHAVTFSAMFAVEDPFWARIGERKLRLKASDSQAGGSESDHGLDLVLHGKPRWSGVECSCLKSRGLIMSGEQRNSKAACFCVPGSGDVMLSGSDGTLRDS